MKISLEQAEAVLLKQFLNKLDGFAFKPKLKKAIRVVHNSIDEAAAIVNVESWRFKEALPFIKWSFNQAQVGFNKSYGVAKIRWWKWVLLPWALAEWAFLVAPFMRKKQQEMRHIAAAVTQIEEAALRSVETPTKEDAP